MNTPPDDGSTDPISEKMYVVGSHAGPTNLKDFTAVPPEELEEINALMKALVRLRETEQALSEASQRYMRLSSQDMKALHYMIVARRQNQIVTPGKLARFLRISAASTTKLLNRLERQEHIVRSLHPTDRRAFAIEITPDTELAANQTVGKIQARRFYSAARLSSHERSIVTGFLNDMTEELSLGQANWAKEHAEADPVDDE